MGRRKEKTAQGSGGRARSAGRCVFCGGAGMSKEHVWPDWLSRFLLFDDELDWVHADDSGIRAIKRAPAFSRKVRKVCTSCNTGWMSRLEEDAKPLLKWMISGRPVSLDFEARMLLAF